MLLVIYLICRAAGLIDLSIRKYSVATVYLAANIQYPDDR